MTIPYDSPAPYDSSAFTYDGESTIDITTTAHCVFVKIVPIEVFVLTKQTFSG